MALPVQDFVIQRLLEFDPTFDTGAGVPSTGLLIEPLSVILQPIIDELSVVQASKSILTILESSDPDAFPEDIVDGLASNAFVERNPGAIGSTVERVRFFEPQTFEAQRGVLIFRGPSGQRYTNSEAVTITAAEMSLNKDGTLFYADIPIIALEEGEAFNVSRGAITQMEAEPNGVANVTNLFDIEDGRDRETNTELIDRIKVAVTVRALVTGRGIIVTLTENFTSIEEIQPIGFGDPEMMRDIVYNVHIGGNVDVYIKAATLTEADADFIGLEVDTARQQAGQSTVVALQPNTKYPLGHQSIDRTNKTPVVRSIDSVFLYTEGLDYTIDDVNGYLTRLSTGIIFTLSEINGTVTDEKTLTKVGVFANVRRGMILTVDSPGSVAGTYTIKSVPDNDTVVIYGEFPVAAAANVGFKIDDNLAVSYEYNPIAVDVIAEAKSVEREPFTITDVPLMYIESVEVLDPLSGDPTGELLDGAGGYGDGGYGAGGFGVGSGVDFRLRVSVPTLRHSSHEDNFIEFSQGHAGMAVRVNYLYASAIAPIQAFMDDRNNQSQTASLLARHFIPIFIDSTAPIVYEIPAASATTAISSDDMLELIKEFIEDIDEGEPLELSDLIDLLYDNGAERVDLGSLEALRGEVHNHDGTVEFTEPTDDGAIEVPAPTLPDPTDRPISPRTARFRARNITLQRNVV